MRSKLVSLFIFAAVVSFFPKHAHAQALWAPCYPTVSTCTNVNGDYYATSAYASCWSYAIEGFTAQPAYDQTAPEILSFEPTYSFANEPFRCTVKDHYGGYANISVTCPAGTSVVPYSGGSCAPNGVAMNRKRFGGVCPVPWATSPSPQAANTSIFDNPSGQTCTAQLGNTGKVMVGEPVDVSTGNMFYAMTDYSTAGQNTLRFTRYYNSRDTTYGPLGVNWHSNFDSTIVPNGSAQAIIQRTDGPYYVFQLTSSVWTTDADVDLKLTVSGSTWTITDSDDNVEVYSGSTPQLTSITARNGYKQTLAYNADGKLATVTDSYGRTLAFTYNNFGLIASLTTPDGTTITYGYTLGEALRI